MEAEPSRTAMIVMRRTTPTIATGVPTPSATVEEAHKNLMLTKALDLSAKLKQPVKLPLETAGIDKVVEALLSVCAGITATTTINPCGIVSALRSPVGAALQSGSSEIKDLPAWQPASVARPHCPRRTARRSGSNRPGH